MNETNIQQQLLENEKRLLSLSHKNAVVQATNKFQLCRMQLDEQLDDGVGDVDGVEHLGEIVQDVTVAGPLREEGERQ
jgi:hypothetical protein